MPPSEGKMSLFERGMPLSEGKSRPQKVVCRPLGPIVPPPDSCALANTFFLGAVWFYQILCVYLMVCT